MRATHITPSKPGSRLKKKVWRKEERTRGDSNVGRVEMTSSSLSHTKKEKGRNWGLDGDRVVHFEQRRGKSTNVRRNAEGPTGVMEKKQNRGSGGGAQTDARGGDDKGGKNKN